VPIHGEKTNVLFHPTPSVSYEPTFAKLEAQAGVVCGTIFIAIIVLGNWFGGSFKGLIPLASCIASGIWLWMKEVVRSGREVEWESEKERGMTVSLSININISLLIALGHSKLATGISRMDEHTFASRLGPDQS
jgi:hypothetical protein